MFSSGSPPVLWPYLESHIATSLNAFSSYIFIQGLVSEQQFPNPSPSLQIITTFSFGIPLPISQYRVFSFRIPVSKYRSQFHDTIYFRVSECSFQFPNTIFQFPNTTCQFPNTTVTGRFVFSCRAAKKVRQHDLLIGQNDARKEARSPSCYILLDCFCLAGDSHKPATGNRLMSSDCRLSFFPKSCSHCEDCGSQMSIYTLKNMHICKHTHIHTYIHTYIYIHTHIHTYIHTYIQT